LLQFAIKPILQGLRSFAAAIRAGLEKQSSQKRATEESRPKTGVYVIFHDVFQFSSHDYAPAPYGCRVFLICAG
jgi:hypothetical protein